ncbi:MAG: VOC family protein [Patulibacter sp.]
MSTPPVASDYQTGHVGLNVSELGRSVDFYTRVFGWDVKSRSDEDGKAFAFLGDQTRLVLTLWQQSGGRFPADQPGLHHLSFQVDSIDEVQAAEARLRDAGARLFHDGIVPHGEGMSSGGIFFEDPDGIRLEIYAPQGADDHQDVPSGNAPTCGFF